MEVSQVSTQYVVCGVLEVEASYHVFAVSNAKPLLLWMESGIHRS